MTINIEFPGHTLISVDGSVDAEMISRSSGELARMIPANTQIWLAAGVTDPPRLNQPGRPGAERAG
jgi:hypothetical protein